MSLNTFSSAMWMPYWVARPAPGRISRSSPPAACVDHSPLRPWLQPGHPQVALCRALPGALGIAAGAAAAEAGRVAVVAVAAAAV